MDGVLANPLDYLQRMWRLRYFWFSLVKNDLSNRYKHSYLGIGWSLLRPVAMTIILCMVFGKLFNLPVAEFAPYLLIGLTTWQFFTESLLGGCYSFAKSNAYIRQQRVPLAIFPLRTVLASGFHSLIALVLAVGISVCFRAFAENPPSASATAVGASFTVATAAAPYHPAAILYLIPAIALLFIMGWFLAIISGVIFTHFPDTVHLLEILLQIFFYVTPILYKPSALENRARLALVLAWNPLSSVLALMRKPVLYGTAPDGSEIMMSLAFVATLGVIAMLLLRKTERTLVFWI